MKAKRRIESSLNSVTMLDGTGGHVSSRRYASVDAAGAAAQSRSLSSKVFLSISAAVPPDLTRATRSTGLRMKVHDRLFLPIFQPKVPGNPAVVFVGPTVAFSPIVEFARGHPQPHNESPGADLAGLRPAPDEVHDLIPHIVRYPDPVQSSPRSFFKAMCSAISSARTSSLRWIFFSRYSMRSCSA